MPSGSKRKAVKDVGNKSSKRVAASSDLFAGSLPLPPLVLLPPLVTPSLPPIPPALQAVLPLPPLPAPAAPKPAAAAASAAAYDAAGSLSWEALGTAVAQALMAPVRVKPRAAAAAAATAALSSQCDDLMKMAEKAPPVTDKIKKDWCDGTRTEKKCDRYGEWILYEYETVDCNDPYGRQAVADRESGQNPSWYISGIKLISNRGVSEEKCEFEFNALDTLMDIKRWLINPDFLGEIDTYEIEKINVRCGYCRKSKLVLDKAEVADAMNTMPISDLFPPGSELHLSMKTRMPLRSERIKVPPGYVLFYVDDVPQISVTPSAPAVASDLPKLLPESAWEVS